MWPTTVDYMPFPFGVKEKLYRKETMFNEAHARSLR